jgi:hypothetical protein
VDLEQELAGLNPNADAQPDPNPNQNQYLAEVGS